MNTTRHQLPHLPAADSHALAQGVNLLNAKRTARADAAAGFVVLLIIGILLACALVHFLTPCEGASLCMAAVITPTRIGLLQRLRLQLRAWRLRWRLADVQNTLDIVEEDLRELPELRRYLRIRRDALAVCLTDIDLATRRH